MRNIRIGQQLNLICFESRLEQLCIFFELCGSVFVVGYETDPIPRKSFPRCKRVSCLSTRSFQLPPEETKNLVSHRFRNETTCTNPLEAFEKSQKRARIHPKIAQEYIRVEQNNH